MFLKIIILSIDHVRAKINNFECLKMKKKKNLIKNLLYFKFCFIVSKLLFSFKFNKFTKLLHDLGKKNSVFSTSKFKI